MSKIHIVGDPNSFTHLACEHRYSATPHSCRKYDYGYRHSDLVAALLQDKIPRKESAVVPIWNSNSGTINMDEQTATGDLFLNMENRIRDLWAERIVFRLSMKGTMTRHSRVFSVLVGKSQCSSFLRQASISTKRFVSCNSTTDACNRFGQNACQNDALLCSKELLVARNLPISPDQVTNPYNITIFATFNTLPTRHQGSRQVFLASAIVNLDGNELPLEFIDYFRDMVGIPELASVPDATILIPKILFILRYQQSKAILVLEMKVSGSTSPWLSPEVDSGIEIRNAVGKISQSFSTHVAEMVQNDFKCKKQYIFYGMDDYYMWVCHALRISVHGFDKDLVRTCATVQMNHLSSLLGTRASFSHAAQKVIRVFQREPSKLGLGSDSKPETP